jgi:two-component system LytT family response regulator
VIDRILVIDDEPLARDRVIRLVRRRAPSAAVREAGHGAAAIELLRTFAPDAVFLDVEMPGPGGLEVIRTIGAERMPPTVFVTAYEEHALAAFDVAAVDYLLKPFDAGRFDRAWDRLAARDAQRAAGADAGRLKTLLETLAPAARAASPPPSGDGSRLVLRQGAGSVVVPLRDVLWIESAGNHVVLHGRGTSWRARGTLARIEATLDGARFVRIHRRFVIDVDALREVRPWSGGDQLAVLEDGAKLPVSRNHRHALAARLAGRS